MIIQNFKYAINKLKENKLYSVLNTTGLSIGFSVVTIIVLFLITEHAKDKNITNYENIYRLYDAEQKSCAFNYTYSNTLLEQYPEIEKACAVRTLFGADIPLASATNNVKEKKAFFTTNVFFDLFDIHVIKSSSNEPLPDYKSAVITQSLATKLFPDEDALGKTIRFFGFVDFVVSAIVADFSDKSLNCNFIIHGDNPTFNNWGQSDNVTISSHYFALRPDTDTEAFTSKLNTFLAKQKPSTKSAGLQKLDNIYLNSADFGYNAHEQGNKKMLRIFLAISILILVLSNINNFNYNLSLQYNSLKDIGVRKTNGAGTAQILMLFIADSFIKVFLSALISIVITILTLPIISSLLNSQLTIFTLLSSRFLVYAFLFFVLITLLNSVASIYIFSKFDIRSFLAGGKSKNSAQIGKSVLTVFQLVISVLLLISMFVIKKQISFVKHANIGFKEEQLVRLSLPMGISDSKAETFKSRITHLPFVHSASLSNGVPGRINYTSNSNVEGNDFNLSQLIVDADFLQTMGINLKAGRDFRHGENNKVCILNETAFKKYGWDDFEGKKFKNWGELDVIGIASDFNISSLHTMPVPVCIVYGDNRDDYAQLSIKLHNGKTSDMLSQIEEQWQSIFTSSPFDYTFYDQFFDAMYKKEELVSRVLSLLALLALLITCLGILCVSFQNSLNKTKEIGIRKVNGAKVSEILSMLNRDFIKWVAIAFVVACPIAYYAMNLWLENFAYKTTLSWWIFALAGVLALGIALLTVSWQSWRAATRNPVEALRYE